MSIDFTGSNLVSVLLLFTAGLVLIIKGGDLFVDAATWIAEASGIPKFIIGATVVVLQQRCRRCWCLSLQHWRVMRILR